MLLSYIRIRTVSKIHKWMTANVIKANKGDKNKVKKMVTVTEIIYISNLLKQCFLNNYPKFSDHGKHGQKMHSQT